MTLGVKSASQPARSPAVVAREVLDMFWDGALPVDPGAIARAAGVELYARGGQGDPYDFSGYFRAVDDRQIIEYNIKDSLVRRRFTVAHELGHCFLGHTDAPRDRPDSFGATVLEPAERAANQFAAELLMPADVVRQAVLGGRFGSVDELADVFRVSRVAMGYRLTNLQLSV